MSREDAQDVANSAKVDSACPHFIIEFGYSPLAPHHWVFELRMSFVPCGEFKLEVAPVFQYTYCNTKYYYTVVQLSTGSTFEPSGRRAPI